MSVTNRIIKNTIYLYVRMLVSIVFSFYSTRILIQALGISDYGLYNVVAGSLAMLSFISSSMSTSTQRFINFVEGEGDTDKITIIFNNAVYLHRIIAVLVLFFFIIGGVIFFNGVLNIPYDRFVTAIAVYICMVLSIIFSITISPYDAVLNAHENMKFYSILGVIDVIIKFLIALLVLFSDNLDKLLLYSILMMIETWLYRLVTKLYCKRNYYEVNDVNFKRYLNKKTLKEMALFAGSNMLNISTGMVSLYGMNVVINHFFGTLVNAAMGVANQISGVMMGVTSNMTKSMTPILVKSEGGNDRKKMIELSIIGCKYSYLLFSFLAIPILFCMSHLLQIWLNEVPKWTDLFCILLIISTLIEQLFVFLFQSINAHGKIKSYNTVRSINNILPLIIMYIGFSFGMPPYFALLNWIFFKAILGGIINLFFAYKNFSFPLLRYLSEVIKPCIFSTIIIIIVCYFVRPFFDDSIFLVIIKLISMFLLSIPVYWFIALSSSEKSYFFNLIKKTK